MTRQFELKGWHAFLIFFSFFAVIIGVNVVMAVMAVRTFPGLEAKNGYVESQAFERQRQAQDALGWDVRAGYEGGLFQLTFDGPWGPVKPKITEIVVGRPTMAADDQVPELKWTGEGFEAPLQLAPGKWVVHLRAEADDGTQVRKRFELWVKEG